MAKSKRSSSQPSRQQRRLARQRLDASDVPAAHVPPGMEALAARLWHEVTGGEGVTLVNGQEVPVKGGE